MDERAIRDGASDGGRVLLLDTCGAEASLALAEGGAVRGRATLPGRSASELLVGVIREEMERAGWRVRELAAVAVVRGPGSFTGVRVGLSVAKGLAEGGGVGMVGLSRLEVLAAKAGLAEGMSVLEAGRGECFWARVAGGLVVEEGLAGWEEIAGGAGFAEGRVACEEADAERLDAAGVGAGRVVRVAGLRAEDGLEQVRRRLAAGERADALTLDALYLRRTGEELLARQAAHREMRRG